MKIIVLISFLIVSLLISLAVTAQEAEPESLLYSNEIHLQNIKQLTFGGENAEAYFDETGNQLIFQTTFDTMKCDQIFTMDIHGQNLIPVSNGKGRTTCSYFIHGTDRVLYSSTYLAGDECPPPPDYSKGYVWKIYDSYDLFTANRDGSDIQRLTDTPGYDAEATVSTDGQYIVFTSIRNGDLDVYTMKSDGTELKQLTNELGYDGGPFFSFDGSKIVYRAFHPNDSTEAAAYKQLLVENIIRPMNLQICIMNADGTDKKQLTNLPGAAFAPFIHPDGEHIIFASNYENPQGHAFDLYMIKIDGTGLEKITYYPGFDSFPMFSPDGKKLVFCSNLIGAKPSDTNVFIADWVW
jgi:TolB protein